MIYPKTNIGLSDPTFDNLFNVYDAACHIGRSASVCIGCDCDVTCLAV